MLLSHEEIINDIFKALIGVVVGFALFWTTSHPKSPIHRKLPQKKIKNISICPNIQITYKNTVFHLHHWMNMSTIYFATVISNRRVADYAFYHGFMVGSILQGFVFPDRLRIKTSKVS